MNIDLFSKITKELLLDNDRLNIPNLGVFVTEIIPSTFSDKGYTINPPYRKLIFRGIKEKDNSLAKFYSKKNNLELEIAEKIINDFTAELKSILEERKVIIFPELGRLRATKENNFFFVADEDLDIYPEGLGLAPISLKFNEESREEIVEAIKQMDKPILVNPIEMKEDLTNDAKDDVKDDAKDDAKEKNKAGEGAKDDAKDEVKKEINEVSAYKNRLKHYILISLGVILGLIVLTIITFLIINHFYPNLIDSILFDPSELELLNK